MIQVIVFDLDDTLLDTSGLIVPPALQKIHSLWVSMGHSLDFNSFLELRNVYLKSHSNSAVFEKILAEFPTQNNDIAFAEAENFFYEPEIPKQLPLIEGALPLLKQLSPKYHLALLTSGEEPTQRQKVESLNVKSFFKDIFITYQPTNYKKRPFFEQLIETHKIQPNQLLSVGNRKTSEIREAKLLGCQTCWFAFGEHIDELEQIPADKPDYTIYKLQDILTTCHL